MADTTIQKAKRDPKDYKSSLKPIWCPGCGDFGVLNAIYKAFSNLNIEPHNIAFFSGIGCSSRIPGYTNTYAFNSVHGRALPLAIGCKLANPKLTVIAAGGDGDGFSIGGGHVAHAVRRNVDMTYIIMDNGIYGLTKGQLSPTTPRGDITSTSFWGSIEDPINPLALLIGYGCGYIAQGTPANLELLTELIVKGIEYKGFAFINVICPCITYRGGHEALKKLKEITMKLESQGHNPRDKVAAFKVAERYGSAVEEGLIYIEEKKDYYSRFEDMFAKAKTSKVFPRRDILDSFIPKG
ncbi:MAG: 2-oxoacid:ferredoxin oxidoreductase subunit beta [Myxococcota bacterium]